MSPTKITPTPYFIIDGTEGCGKGTQVRMLNRQRGFEGSNEMVFTREPGGSPLSDEIRTLFKSELGMKAGAIVQLFLHFAARRSSLEAVIFPALMSGMPIFSDRGDSSTFAYQIYGKQALELEEDFWRIRSLVFEKHAPTLYIFLDVPPEVARARVFKDTTRGTIDCFDSASLEFYQRVYDGFRSFFQKPGIRAVRVDGNRPPEVVHEEIYAIVKKECGWK